MLTVTREINMRMSSVVCRLRLVEGYRRRWPGYKSTSKDTHGELIDLMSDLSTSTETHLRHRRVVDTSIQPVEQPLRRRRSNPCVGRLIIGLLFDTSFSSHSKPCIVYHILTSSLSPIRLNPDLQFSLRLAFSTLLNTTDEIRL